MFVASLNKIKERRRTEHSFKMASFSEKKHRASLKEAAEFKTQGNAAYKAKEIKSAIRNYHRALFVLKGIGMAVEVELLGLPRLPKEIIEERDQLKCECYNNLAACLLLRENPNYQRVVEHCQKVLDYDKTNVKATFRMGTALIRLGKLDKAREVLTSQPHFQSDRSVQNLMKTIQEAEKEEDEKLKMTYRRMFQSDSNPPAKKSNAHQVHAEPILIKNTVTSDSRNESASNATTNPNAKLIHVASAEKEAAC